MFATATNSMRMTSERGNDGDWPSGSLVRNHPFSLPDREWR
jgi:hypothetical protein